MVGSETPAGEAPAAGVRRTIDILRGLSIVAVVAFHFHADVLGVILPAGAFGRFAAAVRAVDLPGALGASASALIGAPTYRVDLFLFVSGVVFALSPSRSPYQFLVRRARAVLPNYWMGSALVALVLVALACVRVAVAHTPLAAEIHHGSRLAGAPYVFEAADLLRSLSLVGRFQDLRAFQVVAPSMWYVMLLLQAYLVFPWLRAFRDRVGNVAFLAAVLAFTWALRAGVFAHDWLPAFGPNGSVLYLIPFRLAPLALGMAASTIVPRAHLEPRRWVAYAGTILAVGWVLVTFWLSADVNAPGTRAGVMGPVTPLALGVPAFWWIAMAARITPGVGPLLGWAGRHSLSILVTQDALRLCTGTWMSLAGGLEVWFWPLLVLFLAASFAWARAWDPLVERVRDRLWPPVVPA